jgi:hypothetical protein
MSDESSPRLNWGITIHCKDCGARYEVKNPDPSTEVIPTDKGDCRLVMLTILNACPDCRNIRGL